MKRKKAEILIKLAARLSGELSSLEQEVFGAREATREASDKQDKTFVAVERAELDVTWYQRQVEKASSELRDAEAELATFRLDHVVAVSVRSAYEERLTAVVQRQAEVTARLESMGPVLEEAKARVARTNLTESELGRERDVRVSPIKIALNKCVGNKR